MSNERSSSTSDNEEGSSNGGQKGWLERLSQALSGGEPRNRDELIEILQHSEGRGLLDSDALATRFLTVCTGLVLLALYLLLANLIGEWPYRHCGVAAVLAFTAVKLGLEPWLHIPVWLSLLVIVGSITSAIVASIRANRQSRPASG